MHTRTHIFSIAVIVLFLSVSLAGAETIILKSGQKVTGKITEQTDSYVTVEVVGVPVTYYLDQIESIEQGEAGSPLKVQGGSMGRQAAGGGFKSNSEYQAIFDTIKNFFENYDNPEEALKSVSKNYQTAQPGGSEVNYEQFSRTLTGKNRTGISRSDFQIIDLKVSQDNAEAKVKFIQTFQDPDDGQVKEVIISRKVFLQKELSGWGIIGIKAPYRGGVERTPE